MKEIITDISLAALPDVVSEFGLKPYAATQLLQWLYQKRVLSFEDMTEMAETGINLLNSLIGILRKRLILEMTRRPDRG